MYNMIVEKIPNNWTTNQLNQKVCLSSNCEEYRQLQYELKVAVQSTSVPHQVQRVQDVYAYGQFLLRGQLMAFSGSSVQYYRVRRYIKISNSYQEAALKYNLDPRRCGLTSLRFSKRVDGSVSGTTVFVVQVITKNYQEDGITPDNSGEYYIEYIANY